MSLCQCQWALCEADIKMELGVPGVYLGGTLMGYKSKTGQESPNPQGTPDSFSKPGDEF